MKQQCRCCLSTNSNMYINIFEQHKSGTTYAENIRYLAEVQIEHDDGLPQLICSNCYNEIQRIYNFGMNVRLSDEKLRQELESNKNHIREDEEQMENVQVLEENEYFTPVEEQEEGGMQVCVIEEILEHEQDQENVLILEEINELEEIQLVEDTTETQAATDDNQKENLLVGLAQVAACQENVNVTQRNEISKEDSYIPEDEHDEDYLIEYNPNVINNFKPAKWKCGECKVVLRGDVSYEGHMNIHKQCRPHTCSHCQTKYRCRAALKRHKDLKHTAKETDDIKILYLCMDCNKNFYSEHIFNLHQILVHDQGDKCPFQLCDYTNANNIKEHIVNVHERDLNFNSQTFCVYLSPQIPSYQCVRCSTNFEAFSLLLAHANQCQVDIIMDEAQNDVIEDNNDIIEIGKVGGASSDVSVQCEVCSKKLLKRNLHKHMKLHKRKEDEQNKESEDNKPYLCVSCHEFFPTERDFDKHNTENCNPHQCTKCEESFKTLTLLQEHIRKVHVIVKPKPVYNCKICGNSFSGHAQLSAHKKLHEERPFKCDQCSKAYPRRVDLDIHMRTHTGELPYKCHICDKGFAIKVRLTYHLQKHEGVTHNCPHCPAVYDNRNKLKAHLFKHTGMPYKCEICPNVGFHRRLRFANHMKRQHQQDLSEEELANIFAKNTGKKVHFKNPVSCKK